MRQRITLLNPLGEGTDPKDIVLDTTSLTYKGKLGATVEKRVTWSLDDIPGELADLLRQCHEIHIRWTRETAYAHFQPLTSRLPVGLHIYFTPREQKQDVQLCPLARRVFGDQLKCHDVARSFSSPPILSERFAQTASFQYYHQLPNLNHLVSYFKNKTCLSTSNSSRNDVCEHHANSLLDAVSLDADYDAISHALTMTTVWRTSNRPSKAGHSPSALYNVEQVKAEDRVEIGVLSPELTKEPEELKLGGYLAVLGENEKPSTTLFSFPARHHPIPRHDSTSFNATFATPTGLHPTLLLTFPEQALKPPRQSCALHAYLTLPSGLFIDRYQLSDPALLASSNLRALHALSGAEDLEAPDWAVDQWGSASLFELAHPSDGFSEKSPSGRWQVQIPLHLRYLQAQNGTSSSYRDVQAPWPITFWACEAEEGLKMATNPFDRVNLGYDGLFGPKTMFYHIPPGQPKLFLDVKVPVLHPSNVSWIQSATLAVVLLGFGWVLSAIFLPSRSSRSRNQNIKQE